MGGGINGATSAQLLAQCKIFFLNFGEMSVGNRVFVFDFNGTLLTRVKTGKGALLKQRAPDARLSNGDLVYVRPHLKKLADFLHENDVTYMFWTTAMEHNAVQMETIVTQTGLNRHKRMFMYSHSTRLPDHPYKRYKDLVQVAKEFGVGVADVRLVDDDQYKCEPPSCHIHVATYDPLDEGDAALLSVIDQIKGLI